MYETLSLYIDGQWCQGSRGETEPVINPANGKTVGVLPHASTEDLDRALAAAAKGFKLWRNTSAYDRAKVLKKAADFIRQRIEHIATTLTLEEGKPVAEARLEVASSADILEWYAEEGRRTYGRIIPGRSPAIRQMMVQEPVGPVAAFTPWNFPAVTPIRKMAGALAAGCSCIIKASEETPGTSVALVRALADAGLPAGVLNLVFGVPSKISEYLLASPIIRKISFTGSVPVGKHLAKLAADGMKRCTMELGGHSPVIIFDDADTEKAAEISAVGKYRNAGQVCIAPTRFFVHEAVHDRFVASFTKIAKEMRLGDGLEPTTKMGPLANPRRLDAMEQFIGDAEGHGAKILAGGKRHGNQGFFFQPTVLGDVPDGARVMNLEPFGPVAPIQRFSDFDDVVKRANALPYGLAAYAFTKSAKTATAIADALESGMVGVNHLAISMPETPFGGIKESGYGHEGGIEGLEAYTNKKFVTQIGV
ncbi:MAG: NAD-dependent succinate-semialdehyde dehydrogenase [Proteobacteria bacterium]|nr:NAD-dependent succinate-semialdehyde dehydrogenase [Pseudomonadota bacterium]